ncbi:YHS domain-containing protein [Agrococcus terreus]|nr:YHS domain-containing protein [Agrococcus terreus]
MCEAHNHHAAATTPEEATAECPVMRGNFVDKETAASQGLVREHEGQTYYLCCAACGPLFDADPERYLAAA